MKYHINSRILHWLMALIIIALLGVGIFMTDFLSKDASYRSEIYHLHKSFGVIALILIFLRIFNRIINKPPKMPITIKKYERFLAHFVHYLLYLIMIIMPLSGYLMSNSYGYEVHLFSIKMPTLIAVNYDLASLFSKTHKYAGYILIFALLFHILGSMKHKFFDRPENDIFKRMI